MAFESLGWFMTSRAEFYYVYGYHRTYLTLCKNGYGDLEALQRSVWPGLYAREINGHFYSLFSFQQHYWDVPYQFI